MDRSAQQFADRYALMSEVELVGLAQQYDSLTDAAKAALRAEFAKRGLEPPILNEPTEFEAHRLVTVRRYRDLPEAIVGQSLLRAAGVEAWLQDENMVRIDWMYSNAVGGIRLQVDAEEKEAAIEILKSAPPSIPYKEGFEYVQPQCSRCGSAQLELLAMANIWLCVACGARGIIVEDDDEEGSTGPNG
jgi:hypothetical protein